MYLERIDSIPSYASPDAQTSRDQLDAHHVEIHKDKLAHYVRSLFEVEAQPHDKDFLMDGIAGLSPVRLTARYLHLRESTPGGVTNQEINLSFAQMVETDMLAYAREFLYRRPILQTEYAIREIDGHTSVISPSYDTTSPLHAHVSLKERDGAVFRGVKNLEAAILDAAPESTIISVSPGGWNGLSPLGLPEDQVHIIHITDNKIVDTTARVTLALTDCVSLIEILSEQTLQQESNERNTIKALTETVVSLPYNIPTYGLLELLETIKGDDKAWNRMKFDRKNNKYVLDTAFSFNQLRALLQQESFLEMSQDVEHYVSELSTFIEKSADTDDDSIKEIVRHIGRTALTISESIGYELGEINQKTTQNGDFSNAVAYAAEGAGCDTSNSSSSFALSEQYHREGIFGHCTQCHSYTSVICGWCMACVLKSRSNTEEPSPNKIVTEEPRYGSFLAVIVGGIFTAITKD